MNEYEIDTALNDTAIRLVLIPFFGLVIPNITGMIDNGRYSAPELFGAYLYFIFIAFAIWQGNRFLLFRLRLRFSWLSQPVYKVLALVVSNIFYTIPISVGLMTMWYVFAQHAAADWNVIFKATALCVVCVVFITHTYETVFLIKSWGSDKTKGEELAKAKAEAELEALKNQIDPHFLFNSLNTLSHLIGQDPAKAREFNDNLAEVYRYILSNKERNLVLLSEEIAFAERYFSLLQIRFGRAVMMTLDWETPSDDLLIPPISLQILLENAVKHNAFTDEHPLKIAVTVRDTSVVITNDVSRKETIGHSSRIGLRNLKERYLLITGQDVSVHNNDGRFTVTLPLLRTA